MSKHEHLFIFKESCKKKSEEVCVVIWTNLDSFANTYLTWVVYFHFPIKFVPDSLQTQKGLELVLRS